MSVTQTTPGTMQNHIQLVHLPRLYPLKYGRDVSKPQIVPVLLQDLKIKCNVLMPAASLIVFFFLNYYDANTPVQFIPSRTQLLYSKTGVYKGIHYFS